jgi:hypothetical protein
MPLVYPPAPISLDGSAADIQPVASPALAGGTGLAADAGHRHPGVILALDSNAADLLATASGTVSVGATGLAADAGHSHPMLRAFVFAAGPWANGTTSFIKIRDDTSLIICYSVSGIKINAIGLIVVDGQLDGAKVANCVVYSSLFAPNEHRACPTAMVSVAGLAAGPHTVGFNRTDANTASDGNDRGSIMVFEVQP